MSHRSISNAVPSGMFVKIHAKLQFTRQSLNAGSVL